MNSNTRPTKHMVNDMIKSVTYTRLPSGSAIVCEITLKNLHTVHGIAQVVDLDNYDEDTGCCAAYDKAYAAVFELAAFGMHAIMHAGDLESRHAELTEAYQKENPVGVHFSKKALSESARKVVHISAGDGDWHPTKAELDTIAKPFEDADANTTFVATRAGVSLSRIP